jgi:hypothetical protein
VHDTGEKKATTKQTLPPSKKKINLRANNQQLKIHIYPKFLTRFQFEKEI